VTDVDTSKTYGNDAWQFQYFLPNQGLSVDVKTNLYWTQADVADHAPILDEQGNCRDEFELWEEAKVKFNPSLHGKLYDLNNGNGRQAWVAW